MECEHFDYIVLTVTQKFENVQRDAGPESYNVINIYSKQN